MLCSKEKLQHLDLSYTGLLFYDASLAERLTELKHLDISHTKLVDIGIFYTINLVFLQHADLSNTHIYVRSLSTYRRLSKLHLSLLHVVEHEICCLQPMATCFSDQAADDIFFSCSDIIGYTLHHVLTYVFILSNIVFNIISLQYNYHILKFQSQILLVKVIL